MQSSSSRLIPTSKPVLHSESRYDAYNRERQQGYETKSLAQTIPSSGAAEGGREVKSNAVKDRLDATP